MHGICNGHINRTYTDQGPTSKIVQEFIALRVYFFSSFQMQSAKVVPDNRQNEDR